MGLSACSVTQFRDFRVSVLLFVDVWKYLGHHTWLFCSDQEQHYARVHGCIKPFGKVEQM